MGVSKCGDGKVCFRNSGLKGLMYIRVGYRCTHDAALRFRFLFTIGGSTPVSTAGGHNGDINGAARQLTYSCVLAVLFGMLLV